MHINLDSIRAVARPYISKRINLNDFLSNLWPVLVNPESAEDQGELANSLEVLVSLHASGKIKEPEFRRRLKDIAYPYAEPVQVPDSVGGSHPETSAVWEDDNPKLTLTMTAA